MATRSGTPAFTRLRDRRPPEFVGVVTEFPVPTAQSGPFGITVGPDGNLWFTENQANQIGQIPPGGAAANLGKGTAQSR